MKPFTNLLFLMCIYHHCIGEGASWYKLLNGTEIWTRCTNEFDGEITIFRDYSSRLLNQILKDENDDVRIWNGYKYTSNWVENTGCFNKTMPLTGYNITTNDMTIAYCEHFCKRYGQFDIAIKESHCLCVKDRNNPIFFNETSAHQCRIKCTTRPDEYCGSNFNSTFYNVYSVRETTTLGYPDITGNGSCLLYKRRNHTGKLAATNCDRNLTSGFIACRSVRFPRPVPIYTSILTWTESMKTCVQRSRDTSYLVSYLDVENITHPNGTIWLNERKYTTVIEKKKDQETLECEILSKGPNGNAVPQLQNCSNIKNVRYFCKTGNMDDKVSTSTVPYQQTITSTSRISPTSQEEKSSLIGGVIGALVLVAVIGGLVFVVVIRMRHTGSCKEDSQYQSQKVKFSKSNGITNNGYCSEAVIDIIQGNPDRNSQENYMTIKDEDLQNVRNAKSEATKSADQNNSSPSDGPLYMVLEDAKTLSEVAASFPNYELAKHISNNESSDKDYCEHNEENVEYDHLRQDAYKQAQEDTNPLADIADDYSHISQVTNVNDDNYTHTEHYMHTCSTTNEEDDAYAHAKNTGYDHMVSEGDTRNSNPYDLAENVDNLQYDSTECTTDRNEEEEEEEDAYAHAQNNDYNSMVSKGDTRNSNPYDLAENVDILQYDSTECKTDSFVQLDADNGNYSFAKPVDVSDGT